MGAFTEFGSLCEDLRCFVNFSSVCVKKTKPKPEPNSPRRPSSSLKRTSTNLKIASTPKNAKSELSQKTWTILFKELEIYKFFTCSHDQLYKRVLCKCSCVWKVLLC